MSQYGPGTTHTCNVTNGSDVVEFSEYTEFGNDNVRVGDWFTLDDDDTGTYEIKTVQISPPQITLTTPWGGETLEDEPFIISRDFTTNYGLPIFHQGDKRVGKNLARLVNMLDELLHRVYFNNSISNGKWSGKWTEAYIDESSIAFGDLLHMHSTGRFKKANANNPSELPCSAMSLGTEVGASKKVLLEGFIRNNSWALQKGKLLFTSKTDGEFTETRPSAEGDQVQIIGEAWDTQIVYFKPTLVVVQVLAG